MRVATEFSGLRAELTFKEEGALSVTSFGVRGGKSSPANVTEARGYFFAAPEVVSVDVVLPARVEAVDADAILEASKVPLLVC